VCAIAPAGDFDTAQRKLLALARSNADYRHDSIRDDKAPDFAFPTIAASPTGELPATHLVCTHPFPEVPLVQAGSLVVSVAGLGSLPAADLQMVASLWTFHWITGREDLADKINEHSAAVLTQLGLRQISPGPAFVPQFDWRDSFLPDAFFACCVICTAVDAGSARQGAWEFHRQDAGGDIAEVPGGMLTIPLSPNGAQPATHFLCTRHAPKAELDRIEAYQQARTGNGLLRVPVVYHVSSEPVRPDETLKAALSEHEAKTLAGLGLRRIA
jgi:hypothetical protein